MNFTWLKRYLPRGLYGRAALILMLPIIIVQLVVSIVFIQRFYEDVTGQMTGNVSIELAHVFAAVQSAPDLATAKSAAQNLADPLDLSLKWMAPPVESVQRGWDDLSGRLIVSTLMDRFPDLLAIDLASNDRIVDLWLATDHGPLAVQFSRKRVSASNPHQLLVLMMATSVLMTVIAYLFLRNQLRPIKRLADASEAFGKGRSVKYSPSGANEVRSAGNAFLDMRARIERQIEQRTMMLSGVSHDLRSPLTRLRLGLSMIDAPAAEDQAEIDALGQDVIEMERLLDAFLDFARSEAGEAPVPSDPRAILADVVAGAKRAGQPVDIGEIRGPKEPVMLRPVAVRRALENLVGNAVRYGERAEISLAVLDRSLRFSVEDPGPGIAAKDREEALKPFARLEPARNQNKGTGVGLGLSIAADVARSHGGTLRLGTSEKLGGLRADLVLAR